MLVRSWRLVKSLTIPHPICYLALVIGERTSPEDLDDTANLEGILKNFKKYVRYSFNHSISVNALCISQNDNDEKGEQVGLMKDVYTSSNKDFLRLGEDLQIYLGCAIT